MWRWGWVSRELLESAESREKAAESRARMAEERLAESLRATSMAQNALFEAKVTSEKLIDRIMQMTGQPPIFSPAPTVQTPPAAPEPPPISTLPPPETRTTFNDVHRAARQAIKDGTITLSGAN